MREAKIPAGKFRRDAVARVKGFYGNGRPAIVLFGEDGSREAVATVNMVDDEPAGGCVWLKGWGENEGLPEALEEAGAVRLTGRSAPAGWADAVEAELLLEVPDD